MTLEPKKLIVLQDIDGHLMPLREDQPLDLGQYDVVNGAELVFGLRNENVTPAIIADISLLNTESGNSSFQGPDEVQPGETVTCTIRIQPDDKVTLESFNMPEIPSSSDILKGKIRWKRS